MGKDPYKYFRVEARELLEGLGRDALELEKGVGGTEGVVRMLRLAHTLKGAARVVGQAGIADRAHAVEDVLAPQRTAGSPAMPPEALDRLLHLLDDMGGLVAALGAEAADHPPGTAVKAPAPRPLENVRIEIGEMDALLEGVFETDVRLAAIRRDSEDVGRARGLATSLVKLLPAATRARAVAEELVSVIGRADRNLTAGLDHADHEIAQVREKAHELRLVPASAVFAELERAARDAAQSLGRQVRLETSGGDHRLEANVLFAVRDALLHVVRNAVAHGIETPTDRLRAGKPAEGLVRLDVQRRGHRIAFVCRDDGRGIDVEAVRRAAAQRGATVTDGELGAEQLLRLVLESGLTTSAEVTQVSGRGIGLDVLRATVERLKGEIRLANEPGHGMTVDVCVPVSLSSVSALVLDAAGLTCCVPLDAVRQTLRLASTDIARSAERDSIVVEGAVVPFMPLARVLSRTPSSALVRAWSTVVLEAGSHRAAIGVDRLVGTSRVVLRPLPRLAGPVPVAAGASLDAEGNPQLVLDPRGLVDAVHAGRGATVLANVEPTRAPVLIIDDSLTTRMLEQSILESAGYAVDLAVSAEEGLAKARAAAYSLFLVDVEMPGMDGFEFVAHTRGDPVLRAIPAILVTSRHSADDRRRGAEVGARAYIVKGEFDQGLLLRTIRLLIG